MSDNIINNFLDSNLSADELIEKMEREDDEDRDKDTLVPWGNPSEAEKSGQ